MRGRKCEKEIEKEIDRKRMSIREGERVDLEGSVFSIINMSLKEIMPASDASMHVNFLSYVIIRGNRYERY